MQLLLAMTPFYLIGNLHCLGMCGPLAMMVGLHRYRYCYFLGRLIAFTLAGLLAGAFGAVLNVVLNHYHLAGLFSLVFGGILVLSGAFNFSGKTLPGQHLLAKTTARANQSLSLLLLRDTFFATFLFGFSTIFLPCGQSLIVFSACALSGSWEIGMLNGCAFALLTSPSLLFAMKFHGLLRLAKKNYQALMALTCIFIGIFSLCRGMAELEFIPHVGFEMPFGMHLALF